VREKPCAVILFDEIEKANERLWDKFLAILDDGQLTSGKGERVYFSESIIVFTSNLGMTRVNSEFRASAELPSHAELTRVVNEEIDRFFAGRLNRPELRNRLGDNIVVFDFIREDSARAILQKQLDLVLKRVKEREQIDVVIAGREDAAPGTAMATLIQECCGNLLNGGRGIGNRLDTVFIGPLTAWIDAHEPKAGAVVRIKRIQPAALGRFEIEAEV
jgi:ATP-dependent Clp protease ATP-binding subunit ClpA